MQVRVRSHLEGNSQRPELLIDTRDSVWQRRSQSECGKAAVTEARTACQMIKYVSSTHRSRRRDRWVLLTYLIIWQAVRASVTAAFPHSLWLRRCHTLSLVSIKSSGR